MRHRLRDKHRLRDLQAVDRLGATLIGGVYALGGGSLRSDNPLDCKLLQMKSLHLEWLHEAGLLTWDPRTGQLAPSERGEASLADTGEREWVVTVRLLPPVTDVHRLPEAARSDIYAYERATGKVTPSETGDDELFLEDVHRLASVRKHVDEDRIWLRAGTRVTNLATGEEFTGDLDNLFRWGPLSRDDENLWPHPVEALAGRYADLTPFTRNAGRKVKLVSGDRADLIAAIDEVRGPSGKVVVKVNYRKYAIFTLDLSEHPSTDAALWAEEDLGWTLIHLEGQPDSFLVQEHVEMTFERRYFVVDHIAVASAGCVEEYHPYSRVGVRFDPRARRHRHAGEDIIWADRQAEALNAFAREVVAEFKRSPWGSTLTEYVLDVAFGPDGSPLVVELNGIRNSGLYASDHGAVIQRLTDRRDVWGKAPHARPRATAGEDH